MICSPVHLPVSPDPSLPCQLPLSDIYYSGFTIYDSRVPTKSRSPYLNLDAFDSETNQLNVIVDTPKGNRNKFEYDEKSELFKLSGVLPVGASFPYDFGFVPSTRGEDGDPLDVLLLMDDPAFVGCLVPARLLGVIEAEQTERSGDTMRNDRLIAVAAKSITHRSLKSLGTLDGNLVDQIEHFFISYNEIKGKQFKPLGRFGPTRARRLIDEGTKLFRSSKRKRGARNSTIT
ncbi:MAG: inorganic diphosphatase [Pyrinomonadaceae bacterium]|jgi:inorganic pyrophosphatase|nr:inorganic diphosphatase [Pyrinomonadaceae bacterium]